MGGLEDSCAKGNVALSVYFTLLARALFLIMKIKEVIYKWKERLRTSHVFFLRLPERGDKSVTALRPGHHTQNPAITSRWKKRVTSFSLMPSNICHCLRPTNRKW